MFFVETIVSHKNAIQLPTASLHIFVDNFSDVRCHDLNFYVCGLFSFSQSWTCSGYLFLTSLVTYITFFVSPGRSCGKLTSDGNCGISRLKFSMAPLHLFEPFNVVKSHARVSFWRAVPPRTLETVLYDSGPL